jgi:hypothetical protein
MIKPKLLFIAVADLGVLGLAYALVNARVTDSSAVSWAVAAVGLVTLFGVLAASDETTKVTTRFALTAAVSSAWLPVFVYSSSTAAGRERTRAKPFKASRSS